MKRRPRIYYSDSQKALMWERWKQGWTLHEIGKLFDRPHTSIHRILAETGGIPTSAAIARIDCADAGRTRVDLESDCGRRIDSINCSSARSSGIDDQSRDQAQWRR
ncbi:putative transposase [Variovorax paradoxus B4]|uniref:Putative transposase n=1 Tax=Variovorax paradoxus B4 TaxID=1246301 RepID=T1X5W5_VARPD|nr:putative transposase [Variovorax paradoxus B4]